MSQLFSGWSESLHDNTTSIYYLFPVDFQGALGSETISISFQRDNEAGAEVIRITDDSTGEVIRQMPSEELLGFMKNLTKMLGAFFDQTS